MDDVYLARGVTIGSQDLLDVGAIEIVRGPQGTLQGRNATAGAILMHSADPTANPEGYITATAQNPSEFRTQGAISGPLGNGFEDRGSLRRAGRIPRCGFHNCAAVLGGASSGSGRNRGRNHRISCCLGDHAEGACAGFRADRGKADACGLRLTEPQSADRFRLPI